MNTNRQQNNQSTPLERKFKKAKQLAAKYGLHSRTIFRWADAGWLHRFKVNDRCVFFDEAEADAFVEQSRIAAPQVAASIKR